MQLPDIDTRHIQLLTPIGFLAAGRGDVQSAVRIFEALALLRPEHAFPLVGLATALMNSGRAAEAVQRLQSVHLPAGPETDMLRALHGLALQLAGRNAESHFVLRQVVAQARCGALSDGARLACRALGEEPGVALPDTTSPALSI